jgi:hypothetical protein
METEFQKEIIMIARSLEMELNKQKGFRNRVSVRPVMKGNVVDFIYTFPDFGTFLDLGTGPYKTSEVDRGTFNRKPGPGTDGIKPRFWMSINDNTKLRIQMLLQKVYVNVVNKSIIKAMKK